MKELLEIIYSCFPNVELSLQRKIRFIPMINSLICVSSLIKKKIVHENFLKWLVKHYWRLSIRLIPAVIIGVYISVNITTEWIRSALTFIVIWLGTFIESNYCIKCQEKIAKDEDDPNL